MTTHWTGRRVGATAAGTPSLGDVMSNNPQTDRIPLGHSVRYAVRGLPEVPNQYGPGTLEPREITLTYRAAPDSQLGRVHAYVAGRIWVNGAELPLLPGGLYGQHYDDGLDGWPEWLAEEARLHDPAATPAVPVPPTTHATDEERRDRIIPRAVRPLDIEHDQLMARAEAEHQARVVAEQARKATDRAAVLREAADVLDESERLRDLTDDHMHDVNAAANELRRMAAEAQQQPDIETPYTPPAHYVRDDGVQCCVHAIPVGPDSCRECRDLDQPAVPAKTAASDVLAKAVAALQAKAAELSTEAEEEMRRDLEEQAQVWHEAADMVRRVGRKAAPQ